MNFFPWVPRSFCDQCHQKLITTLDDIKHELTLARSEIAELVALNAARSERASAAAKKAFALRLQSELDHGPSEAP